MSGIGIEPWEPGETIGKLWHALARRLGTPNEHEGAAVDPTETRGDWPFFLPRQGGDPPVEPAAAADEVVRHRPG